MRINLDERLAALNVEPLEIILDGETYTGHIISIDEFSEFFDRFAGMDGKEVPTSELYGLLFDIFKKCGLPAEKVRRLPPAIALEVVNDFFEVYAPALGMNLEEEQEI